LESRHSQISNVNDFPDILQIRALREYAVRRSWTITLQVKEVGSGASERQLREKLLESARRREIDVVLVWRLDRWGRSVTDLLATLQELEHLGVGFVSLTEALDLTTPAGRAMAGLLAVFAAFEREILGERVRAGLAHAQQNGKRLGRPPTAARHTAEIRKLHRAGVSKSEVARRLQIGRTSVRRILTSKRA
jgi:DNA invertase Pin-like site-specific DNA recombinase